MTACDYDRVCRVLEAVAEAIRTEAMSGLLQEARSRRQEIAQLEAKLTAAVKSGQQQRSLPWCSSLLACTPSSGCRATRPAVAAPTAAAGQKTRRRATSRPSRQAFACHSREHRDAEAELADALRRGRVVAARYPPFAGGRSRPAGHHPAFARDRTPSTPTAPGMPRRSKDGSPPRPTARKCGFRPGRRTRRNPAVVCRSIGCSPGGTSTSTPCTTCRPSASIPARFSWPAASRCRDLAKPYPTNLLPSADTGMLGRVAKMVPRRAARSAWGIDLGASGLKAVRLAFDGAKGPILLSNCAAHRIPQTACPGGRRGRNPARDRGRGRKLPERPSIQGRPGLSRPTRPSRARTARSVCRPCRPLRSRPP